MNAHVCAHMHLSVNLVYLLHGGGHTGVQSHLATMFSLSRILERYIVMRSTPQSSSLPSCLCLAAQFAPHRLCTQRLRASGQDRKR